MRPSRSRWPFRRSRKSRRTAPAIAKRSVSRRLSATGRCWATRTGSTLPSCSTSSRIRPVSKRTDSPSSRDRPAWSDTKAKPEAAPICCRSSDPASNGSSLAVREHVQRNRHSVRGDGFRKHGARQLDMGEAGALLPGTAGHVCRVSSGGVEPTVRMLTFTDYHPFLHVRTLVDAIAAAGGYTIRSDFMDGAPFRSLYMSGRYPEQQTEPFKERMGFLAGRFGDATASADRFGRVYADPLTAVSSVGNLVDTADPDRTQDGATVAGVYNRNDCFREDGQRIAYCPVEEVTAGFEYSLAYRTDYRIASREELKCFDRVLLDDDVERRFRVVNRHEDRRTVFHGGWQYRLIVFGHQPGTEYRFSYRRIANPAADTADLQPGDYETVRLKTFSQRSVLIDVPADEQATEASLEFLSNGTYIPYEGDWALYDGYVAETGQIDIRLTIRSAAREIAPSSPRYFDRVYFGGADQGMNLTLGRRTTLKPIFLPHPCEGSTVRFADVAAHRVRQIDLIGALKQMFNLCFYSDALTGTLYIEPRDDFYRDDTVIDWSDRIDRSRPVTVEELGADLSKLFTLRYQEGDGTVARWDEREQTDSGPMEHADSQPFRLGGRASLRQSPFHAHAEPNRSLPRRAGRLARASRRPGPHGRTGRHGKPELSAEDRSLSRSPDLTRHATLGLARLRERVSGNRVPRSVGRRAVHPLLRRQGRRDRTARRIRPKHRAVQQRATHHALSAPQPGGHRAADLPERASARLPRPVQAGDRRRDGHVSAGGDQRLQPVGRIDPVRLSQRNIAVRLRTRQTKFSEAKPDATRPSLDAPIHASLSQRPARNSRAAHDIRIVPFKFIAYEKKNLPDRLPRRSAPARCAAVGKPSTGHGRSEPRRTGIRAATVERHASDPDIRRFGHAGSRRDYPQLGR